MRKTTALLLCLIPLFATRLQAQACIGGPERDGKLIIAPSFRYQKMPLETLRTYGVEAAGNLAGRFGLEGGYGYTHARELGFRQHGLSVRPSLEVVRGPVSVCAVAGVQVNERRDDATLTASDGSAVGETRIRYRELLVPVGVGLGAFRGLGERGGLTVYAVPQALQVRFGSWVSPALDGNDLSAMQNTTAVGLEAGARLRLGAVTAGASLLHTTWAGLPNAWTFLLGFSPGR